MIERGTNFTARLMSQLHKELSLTAIRTSPYPPETDGLVERFNQTLKRMLKKYVCDTGMLSSTRTFGGGVKGHTRDVGAGSHLAIGK